MKRLAFFLFFSFVILASIVVIRAARFKSRQPVVDPAPAVTVDEEKAARVLGRAIQLKTISYLDSSKNDFGEWKKLHAHLAQSFPRVHRALKKELVGDYTLLYEWTGTEPALAPIVLMAHQDVVPISPGTEKDWIEPPWSGAIKDGFIWGRGALDDKGGMIALLEAAEWLLENKFQPRRTLLFSFGHDEEVGGGEGAKKVAELLKARNVQAEMVLDEGGIISHGMMEGFQVPIAFVGIAEKGYLSVELTARAQGGHSSMPPGRTAIGTLAKAVTRLEAHPLTPRLMGPVREMLTTLGPEMSFAKRLALANMELFGPALLKVLEKTPTTNALIRTTTAPTVFQAGEKDNVLPANARAVVNFRVLPGQTSQDVLAHVRKVIDDDSIELKHWTHGEPSAVSDVSSESFSLLQRVIKRTFPTALVSPYLTLGGTDTKHFGEISPRIFRFLPAQFGPDDMARFHGTNERIATRHLGDMIRFYIDFLREGAR